jgi:hypothetical protein
MIPKSRIDQSDQRKRSIPSMRHIQAIGGPSDGPKRSGEAKPPNDVKPSGDRKPTDNPKPWDDSKLSSDSKRSNSATPSSELVPSGDRKPPDKGKRPADPKHSGDSKRLSHLRGPGRHMPDGLKRSGQAKPPGDDVKRAGRTKSRDGDMRGQSTVDDREINGLGLLMTPTPRASIRSVVRGSLQRLFTRGALFLRVLLTFRGSTSIFRIAREFAVLGVAAAVPSTLRLTR